MQIPRTRTPMQHRPRNDWPTSQREPKLRSLLLRRARLPTAAQEAEDIDNADAPSGTVVSRDAEGLCEGPGGSSKPAAEAGGTWGSGSTSRLRPGSGSPTSAARFGSASGGTSAIARAIAEGERSGRRALEILADHSGLAGCKHCRGMGYRGRKAVGELLVLSDETREAIVNRAPVRQLKELAQQSGVRLVRAAALDLVRRGHTTLEEVNRVTVMA